MRAHPDGRCVRVLLASLWSALAAAPASASGADRLGVVDHLNYQGVSDLGARWMRMPVWWRYIEPADDTFNWSSGLDAWLEGAEAIGLRGSIVISCGQFWATGHTSWTPWPSHPPQDMQFEWDPVVGYSASYYDFISNLVTAYRGRIDRITIENEVNTRVFWAGTSDDYRRLVATAAKAVEEHAPEILVFDSGLGSGSWGVAVAQWMIESGELPQDEILTFVNDYYDYDIYAPLRFNSFHELAYWLRQPFVQENNKRVDAILGGVAPHIDALNFKFTNSSWLLPTLIEWMDRRLALHGYAFPMKVNNEASNWPRSSATEEGQNLFEIVILALANGVEQSIWFPYSNESTSTPRVGLLDSSGNWTKQADAFSTLSRYVGTSFEFDSQDVLGSGVNRVRLVALGEERPACDVLWWDDGTHGTDFEAVSFTLPEPAEAITQVSWDGVVTELGPGTKVTATIGKGSQLFIYTFSPLSVGGSAPAVAVNARNAPNPLRGETVIELSLPASVGGQEVSVRIFDALGRAVRSLASGPMSPGSHAFTWDARDDRGVAVEGGSYWFRVTTGEGSVSGRMLVLR